MNENICRSLRPLITVLVVIAVIGSMRITSVVTMPLGLAVFIVILAWPLQSLLERKLPRGVGYLLTLLAILAVFGFFVGLLVVCAESVAAKAPEYEERVSRLYDRLRLSAEWRDMQLNSNQDGPQLMDRAVEAFQGLARWTYQVLGFFTLTVTFTVLGLIEVHSFREKLRRMGGGIARRLFEAGEELSRTLRRYMLARTIISGTTGLLVGIFTWAIGLDFALVWGVTAFLLNYIPILGSLLAVIPPTIVAFIQPDVFWMGPATLAGLTVIQFTIGNYIDPQLEGHILSLSPIVLFFSIVFWGWIWGIPGALMGIPITATVVIFCRKFENSQWVAQLLEKPRAGGKPKG